MSSTRAPSALNAETEPCPVLTVAQINRLQLFDPLSSVERGEGLHRPGEVPLYLLLWICLDLRNRR